MNLDKIELDFRKFEYNLVKKKKGTPMILCFSLTHLEFSARDLNFSPKSRERLTFFSVDFQRFIDLSSLGDAQPYVTTNARINLNLKNLKKC